MTGKRRAVIVVDLGFGDAGKGSIVDWLARSWRAESITVVRFNGGAQAGHNVVLPDGRAHTFSQFGSGTFVPGARTHLSRFMLFDPLALTKEAAHLESLGVRDPMKRLTVDARALVVTPYHKMANRFREILRGAGRHGSCGMGIGEAVDMATRHPEATIRAEDLRHRDRVLSRLEGQRKLVTPDAHALEKAAAISGASGAQEIDPLAAMVNPHGPAAHQEALAGAISNLVIVSPRYLDSLGGDLIFEGAQGVLIDQALGYYPYVTRSNTTPGNARQILREAQFDGTVETLGVLRVYFVRHGPGPFPTEEAALGKQLADKHNPWNQWQGAMRFGWFDAPLARYALKVCAPVDGLAITCLDDLVKIEGDLRVCRRYGAEPEYETAPQETNDYMAMLRRLTGATIAVASSGPTWEDKRALSTTAGRSMKPGHLSPCPQSPRHLVGGAGEGEPAVSRQSRGW